MTTDITELAQRMKAAAVRAQAATEEYASQRISSTAFRLEIEEFESLANKPANAIALVEALEKALRANVAQDDHINQQQDRIDQLEKRNADLGKYVGFLEKRLKGTEESLIASTDMVTELESRTVKLPGWFVKDAIAVYDRDDVEEALTAAGIKWEGE